jgi:hypothetical protein
MRQFSPLQVKTASSIWQRSVKSARSLVGLLIRAIPLMMGASSPGWVKAAFVFARFAQGMIRSQGHRGLALHLKAANVILLRFVSGEPLSNARLAGSAVSLTHSGLPRLIVGAHRLRISQGEVGVIRFWIGLFTLYRVLDFKGKVSFDSVVGPGRYLSVSFMQEWIGFIPRFVNALIGFGGSRFRLDYVPPQFQDGWRTGLRGYIRTLGHYPPEATARTLHLYKPRYVEKLWGYVVRLVPLMKSGANSKDGSTSASNVVVDMVSWLSRPMYVCHLITLVALTGCWNLVDNPAWRVAINRINELKARSPSGKPGGVNNIVRSDLPGGGPEVPAQGWLGRLHIVEEPGKMRVVAMVDSLTQWFLYPLHRFIFDKLLRVIPQDGTFDQLRPVTTLLAKMTKLGLFECFSYDLSAATDRLPVIMQEFLLSAFTSREFAHHWRCLLTKRNYAIPRAHRAQLPTWSNPEFRDKSYVRYACGQPMGAYSSWAMLALVHHAIVQFAAKRANVAGWFDLYAVLGDDVVIGHRGVANEYTKVMEEIGVNIGFHKSIISKNRSLEFAKRFFYKGVEVTPLPLVAIAVSWISVNGLPEILTGSLGRIGKFPSLYSIARSLGIGFKGATRAATSRIVKLPKRLRSAVLVLSRPGPFPWSRETLWDWVRMRSLVSVRDSGATWTVAITEFVRSLIVARSPQVVRRSLFRAFQGFTLPSVWAQEVVGLHEWWAKEVVAPYKEPMFATITEYESLIDQFHSKDGEISDQLQSEILESFEKLERLACRLPVKVELSRNIKDVVQGASDRFPKTVRRWVQFQRRLRGSGLPA